MIDFVYISYQDWTSKIILIEIGKKKVQNNKKQYNKSTQNMIILIFHHTFINMKLFNLQYSNDL